MTETPFASTCRCGTSKLLITAGSSIRLCPNCDTVQDTEYGEDGYRRRTAADRRYHYAWERLKLQFYKDAA